jgi:hypothetical protein
MLNQSRFDSKGNRDPGYSDEIMATCVADSREGIHFRIHAEYTPSIPVREGRGPSGIEMIMFFHVPAMFLHERSEDVVGVP